MYIPVSQRNIVSTSSKTSGYIPVAQRGAQSSVNKQKINYLNEEQKIYDEQARVAKQQTKLGPVLGTSAGKVGGFFREVGQSIARNIGSAALSLSTPKGSKVAEPLKAEDFQSYLAQGLFETVFGKDQEIKPIETRIAEAEPKIKDWQKGLQQTLDNTPNLNPVEKTVLKTLANLSPKSTAFIGIMGSVGMDLTPFGGLEKNAFKQITKAKTIGQGLEIGRKLGIADDLLDNFAKQAVKVANDTDAEKLFKSTANLQQTTKVKPGYVPVEARITSKTAPETTIATKVDPLIQEAKKYKSAEEFVKAQEISGANRIDTGAMNNAKFGLLEDQRLDKSPDLKFILESNGISPDAQRVTIYRASPSSIIENGNFAGLTKETAERHLRSPRDKIYEKTVPISDLIQGADQYEVIYAPKSKVLTKSQLTDIWKKAQEVPEGLPKLPSIQGKANKTSLPQKPGQLAETIPNKVDSYKPTVPQKIKIATQRTTEGLQTKKVIRGELPKKITKTEPQLLKSKLKNQEVSARRSAKTGEKVGIAKAENIAKISKDKAVRKEQLKALKGGIEIRAKKDAIINVLKTTTESTERVKAMITQHIKDALDTADRGKALTLVRDAKTQKDLTKAFARINRWAEESIKKDLKNEILKTQKSIMDSPSVAIDYKARVKELMGDFELKGHREATLERLKKTQEFLQSEIAKGNDVEVPRRVLKSLEILNRTPFDEITINQLTGLKAEMELLEGLGRTKFRTTEAVWEIQKSKILEEITKQGAKPLKNIELIKPEIGERLTFTQKFKNLIWSAGNEAARIDKAISPMDTVFDLLDGGKGAYNGANFRFFKGQVDSGYGRYISRKDALQKPVFDLEAKYKLADTNYERIGVVAAREQDGGVEKLLASGFTKEQINAVKLTPPEQEMLDLMRSTFDSQFPEIKEVMKKVYNQPVEKVKNYFSFMTDWKAMDESEVFQRFGSQAPEQYGTPRKNVEAGFTKSRVGGNQKIKINAMDVFTQHTDNTSYLLELGETSKMLGEVAASPQYAELVGDVGQLMVREWLDVIARKGGAAGASEIAVLNTLRKNVGIGILGLKLSTVAIQPTALIDGMGFIGAKYGTKGTTNFLTSKEWRKFVLKMPEIADRMGGEFALRELTDDNWLQTIQRKGFIPMQKLDQITAGSIAAGAYERKMIELGLDIDLIKPFNKEALEYAQLAVRRTQSSGAFKDVPLAISRGALTGNRSLDRAMLQFQNFLLTRWSRIRHDAIRAGINTKDPKKAIPIFISIIMAALASSGIRLGVNKIQDFITGKEDEDTVQEDLTKSFVFEMTGNVPFVGTALSMAMYDGEMFPILDAPKGVISGLNRVITSKSESAKLRGFAEFAGSMGALLGIPGSAQTEQLVRGALQDEKKKSTTNLPTLPKLPKLPSLPKLK